jgi:hypothetical protein
MTASIMDLRPPTPAGTGYDAAAIVEADGTRRSLSRPQYERLPLAERIRLVLSGRVEFYRGGVAVPPNEALKVTSAL